MSLARTVSIRGYHLEALSDAVVLQEALEMAEALKSGGEEAGQGASWEQPARE
jgi:hypothetical protein